MARIKSNNVQVNISIPSEWKAELENLDLMRRGIQEKYQLGEQAHE